jgi:hypothetical protein
MTDDTPAEPSFRHRRWYTYAGGLIYAALIAAIVWKLAEPGALKWVALGLIAANVLREGFYMAGASLADWAMVTKAWRRFP